MRLRSGFLSFAPFALCLLVSPAALSQSGRAIPAPPAKPTPSPETAAPNQTETKRRVVIESADTYILVFPTLPSIDSFGEQLNKAGVDRYKLTSAVEDQLMFEQGPVADGQRHEYKVLNLEFQIVEDLALRQGGQTGVRIELTASSKETMKLLNSLAQEGFVVRDLFVSEIVSNKVSVFLERLY
jgi:hypothetical protein